MIEELFGAIFGTALGADAGLRRSARRLRAQGRVLGSIRVRVGEADGISKHWRVREMTPMSGRISFDSVSIEVSGVYRRSEPPTARERFGIQLPEPHAVLDLQTAHAQLELAVATEDVNRVIETLTAPPEPESD